MRALAVKYGLAVADRAESQEICFISNADYARIASEYIPGAATPGPVLSTKGKILGEHRGILHYTVGQRHGLGIAAPEPLYVVAIKAGDNTIIAGSRAETCGSAFTVAGINWIMDRPEKPVTADVKIRYRHPGAEAEIVPLEGECATVTLKVPQMAIAPGQAAVFYRGDAVMGGGTIEEVLR